MDTILVGQEVDCVIDELDEQGNPVPFSEDNPTQWGAVPAEAVLLTPSADGSRCRIKGLLAVPVAINASLSVGNVAFSGAGNLQVNPGAVKSIALRFVPVDAAPAAAPQA